MAGTRPRDPYEVLGVARDADETAIKKAFRRLARELHPDVNRHDPDAEEKFKEAAEAYEILSDAERRATFDRYGHDGLRSGGYAPNFEGFGSISDLFDAFFGSAFGAAARGGPMQGGDVAVSAHVTLAQAATGAEVELSFEAIDTCERCHGNGAEPGTPIVTCERCAGAGVLQAVSRSPFGQVVRQVAATCAAARGACPSSRARSARGAGARCAGASCASTSRPGSATGSASAWPDAATRASAGGRPATSTCSSRSTPTSASCATATIS